MLKIPIPDLFQSLHHFEPLPRTTCKLCHRPIPQPKTSPLQQSVPDKIGLPWPDTHDIHSSEVFSMVQILPLLVLLPTSVSDQQAAHWRFFPDKLKQSVDWCNLSERTRPV